MKNLFFVPFKILLLCNLFPINHLTNHIRLPHIFWDEESSTIKSFMEYYNKATKVPIVHIGKYLVWLADQISHFNKLEKRCASREVNDVAEGRYDWRIQRSQNRSGGRKR